MIEAITPSTMNCFFSDLSLNRLFLRTSMETTYHEGRKAMMLPLNISRSAKSIPIGATKNRLNRNFRRNMIIIMATMTKIM
jgi:hypothetical protein